MKFNRTTVATANELESHHEHKAIMPPFPNNYESCSQQRDKGDDGQKMALLPHSHEHRSMFFQNGDGSGDGTNDHNNGINIFNKNKSCSLLSSWIIRHRFYTLSILALGCLVSLLYRKHNEPHSYNSNDVNDAKGVEKENKRVKSYEQRVPMPPPLSTLDPALDLGFRTVIRDGLAAPSLAWGKYLNREGSSFVPLPTNAWYLNLLSHRAATDPSAAEEIAHVYAIPYVVGVSPPEAPSTPESFIESNRPATSEKMAGIELFLPVMKSAATNMQIVFDRNNGLSLGAVVEDNADDLTNDDETSMTSYEVDSAENISPLGVSLKWKHINMKTHIVRGMPYGTVRFGKKSVDDNYVLPTILSGNRPRSILIDSDAILSKDTESISTESIGTREKDEVLSAKDSMLCGTFSGEPVEQAPDHAAPITETGKPDEYIVQREIIVHLDQSDFTWIVFFSKPVKVKCYSDVFPLVSVPGENKSVQFRLDVSEVIGGDDETKATDDEELVVRMALLNECTTGKSIVPEHCDHLVNLGYETISSKELAEKYLSVLRKGKHLYAKSPLVGTQFPEDDSVENGRITQLVFDWDATSSNEKRDDVKDESIAASSLRISSASSSPTYKSDGGDSDSFIMFALPHHRQTLAASNGITPSLCVQTFHGRTCLVKGNIWNLPVAHGNPQSFLADRPPLAKSIPALAKALNNDINFKLSENVFRGAAETYFSSKVLAKVGRIIEITKELQDLKSGVKSHPYSDVDDSTIEESLSAASKVILPEKSDVDSLIDDLQGAVEIWLKPGGKGNGGAEAEYLYDSSWGGFINCGCNYSFDKENPGAGTCANSFPICPAIDDVNTDFGNGWYNDHHFHYGYNIYAAAVVAKNRPEWGRKYFDRVLLYIRDIANPSKSDEFFPMFRQKDWYLGNSWAGGLMSMELSPHGREQESSSEAIAAFEGIALFGSAMIDAFSEDEEKLASARLVRNLGEFLTSMEVDAANRYWHVWGPVEDFKQDADSQSLSIDLVKHTNTYPSNYIKPVVGMMYETMASFQTWFSSLDVVSYGIQLIPLTAVSERRDDPEWSNILYPFYAQSCLDADKSSDGFCEKNGWSIIQAGLLAETSEIDKALDMALKIPEEVFLSDGACGNSLSNTIWFISTRKASTKRVY